MNQKSTSQTYIRSRISKDKTKVSKNKVKIVQCRLTKQEHEKLAKAAKSLGLNMSDFIRRKIL